MKKMMTAALTAAAMTLAMTSVVMADGGMTVKADGVEFEIPEELSDKVIVRMDDLDEGTLVEVYEKASVEAAEAQGREYDGSGYIFGIVRVTQDELRELRCGGMDGMIPFAENGDSCLIYETPTDVRFVRESYDDVEEDQKEFSELNTWAYDNVITEVLANNSDLEAVVYTNTDVDMYLARALFVDDTNYELRSLEYGTLDPKSIGENDFIEELTEGYLYELAGEDMEGDGEYYVLAFPDDDVRFEFFKSDENLIREVRTAGDEEYVQYFIAEAKDINGTESTATGIVRAWCEAIAEA